MLEDQPLRNVSLRRRPLNMRDFASSPGTTILSTGLHREFFGGTSARHTCSLSSWQLQHLIVSPLLVEVLLVVGGSLLLA